MHAYLHCLSHSPLVGYVDPAQEVLDEVNGVIASARERIAAFSPELVVLFAPDHYNGFFYDVMPPFCLGVGATAIGDFGSAAGELPVPVELAEACAHAVMKSGIDLAVSYCMQVDHGFSQPLEFLLGGLDKVPVLPVFINGVATPLPGFQRTRMLGEAIGRFTSTLNKRVLFLGSGGLSHQPPVPELAKADAHMRDRLLGSGKDLPASERELRQQRVISAAVKFVEDQRTLHPLNPIWDNQFMTLLEQDAYRNWMPSVTKSFPPLPESRHMKSKPWVAAFAAISAFGNWRSEGRYYRPIPSGIAGFGLLSARTERTEYAGEDDELSATNRSRHQPFSECRRSGKRCASILMTADKATKPLSCCMVPARVLLAGRTSAAISIRW